MSASRGDRRRAAKALAAGTALAVGAWSAVAAAHEVGLSRGEYSLRGSTFKAEVIFARKELANLVAGLDADHDGGLTPAEIDNAKGSIEGALVGRIKVSAGGAPCAGTLDDVVLTEQDGVELRATYRCRAGVRAADVRLTWLDDVPFGHRHLARATGSSTTDRVLSQRSPSFSFEGGPEAPAAPPDPAAGGSPFRFGLLQLVRAPETAVFLIGLLAACARSSAAALASGLFGLGIAAGLAAGALGAATPSPWALAVAAALSLAYIGVDNLAPGERARPWIGLPFGVVHGLLAVTAVQGSRAMLPGFSLGVAVALGATVVVMLPAIGWATRRKARAGSALSVAVAAAGLIGVALRLRAG